SRAARAVRTCPRVTAEIGEFHRPRSRLVLMEHCSALFRPTGQPTRLLALHTRCGGTSPFSGFEEAHIESSGRVQRRSHMRTKRILSLSLSLVVLASFAGAQDTSAITIGGPGSMSSAGFNDPGLLGDGITPASARYQFALDVPNALLTVTVDNTS